ncbi:hypothetical protein BSKO_11644 [Bryopsis sp. KO-2023]|nr:hypothetical protein BSKO_11644 [Bryopsis sp. KO-2023]
MGLFQRLATLVSLVAFGIALSGKTVELSFPSDIKTKATKFAYLFSLGLSIGVADWHSFVFGLVAFKTLPRQSFGLLQSKLFPLYFQILVLASSSTLVTYTLLRTGSGSKEDFQFYILIGAVLSWLLNLLFFEPWTSAVMFERHKFEREEKTDGKDVKEMPKYKKLSKKFGMYHGLSSLSNLIGLVCLHIHAWHAATTLLSF